MALCHVLLGAQDRQSPGVPGPGAGPSSGGPDQTSIRPHERSTRLPSPRDALSEYSTSPDLIGVDRRTRPAGARTSTCQGKGGRMLASGKESRLGGQELEVPTAAIAAARSRLPSYRARPTIAPLQPRDRTASRSSTDRIPPEAMIRPR